MTEPQTLSVDFLATLMQEAVAMPLRAVREMQAEFFHAQATMTQQSLAVHQTTRIQQEERLRVQQTIIAQLASSADADPLRKLRAKDPQFPAFTGRTDHFLPLHLECHTRQEHRNLPDAVAIQQATMAMVDTLRGIFPAGQTFPNWDEFVNELKPKFMPHSADWALSVEFEQWNVRGDRPRFHSVVPVYKLCLDSSLHPALVVSMIKALDPYLR